MASVTKRGNSYIIRASLGYDSKGKQIQRFKTWKPKNRMSAKQIEKELERQKVLFDEQCRNGQYMDGNIKFSDFVDYWFKEYANKQLRSETLAVYRELLKRVNTAIGHIRLNKLQPHHLMEFYNNLSEENTRSDVKYTAIVKDTKALLKKHKLTQASLTDRAGVSKNTVANFMHHKNIAPSSAMKISDAINMDMDKLFRTVNPHGTTLSTSTISKYHRFISSILEKAVKWQVIISNPCSRVEAPKVQIKEKKYLDEFQTVQLIQYLDTVPLRYKAIVITLLYSGMRRGELCGLDWADIDFQNSLVQINKSLLYTVGKGLFEDTTKNESSKRVIKLPAPAMEILKQYRAEQTAERLKLGDKWINSGKVFVQWNGKPIHPDTITKWFSDFIKQHDLPNITIHSLRHTNATLLIAGGADLRTVSKRLGHSNMSTTANIYTHAIQSADERAAQIFDDMLKLKKASAK